MIIAREKELEKKKKEKEELEEQKRKEKEEKERKKKEEKEAKKREEEEKKAKLDEQKLKSSLFQRLFQRSQSRASGQDDQETCDQDQDLDMVTTDNTDTCPPVPAHQQLGYMSQASMDARLSELEQLISASNNGAEIELDKLDDNILSELSRQYPPEGGAGLSATTATPTNDINQSQPVQT